MHSYKNHLWVPRSPEAIQHGKLVEAVQKEAGKIRFQKIYSWAEDAERNVSYLTELMMLSKYVFFCYYSHCCLRSLWMSNLGADENEWNRRNPT